MRREFGPKAFKAIRQGLVDAGVRFQTAAQLG
jgi:hypothetical protein